MSQRWASPMDWAGRRDVITSLYMDRQLPLPRVMEVMERDYDFHATPRMYKTRFYEVRGTRTRRGQADPKVSRDRFRKWKLFKYNVPGASEASQVSTRGSAPGNALSIRRRSRQNAIKEGSGEPPAGKTVQATADPTVLSRSLSPPRIFLLPETVVSLTQHFFDDQLQRHRRYRFDESREWWWSMESAMRLVEANRLQEGFGELNEAFDRFAVLIKDPEIGLLSVFYNMLIRLGPLLGGQLLDYATRMAMIKLGRGHPLTLVFDTLRRAGPQEIRNGGYMILRMHFQAAERALGGTDAKTARYSAFLMQAMDWHHVDSGVPADSATIEVELWRSYERLLAAGLVVDARETLTEIAMMHVRYRRYDEAKRLADQIALCAEGCTEFDAQMNKRGAWRVRYLIAREMDDMDECFSSGMQHLMSDYQRLGPENHRLKATMAQAQAHFRQRGRPELAVKLAQDLAKQARALSEARDVEFKREIVEEEEEEEEEEEGGEEA